MIRGGYLSKHERVEHVDGKCARKVRDQMLGALKSKSCYFNEHLEEKNEVCSFFIDLSTLVYFFREGSY